MRYAEIDKTPCQNWKDFMACGWNAELIWNSDNNDEIKDVLSGRVAEKKIVSEWYHNWEDRKFEIDHSCPWAIRDLYQIVNIIMKRDGSGMALYNSLNQHLGHLRDNDGRAFDFSFALPADFFDKEDWNEIETDDCPF